MRLFFLFLISFTTFFLVSCDNPVQRKSLLNPDTQEITDEVQNDSDIAVKDIVWAERRLVSPEFLQGERVIDQKALLKLTTGEVVRNFNFVDTSFKMHTDDLAAIIEKLDTANTLSLCQIEPVNNDDYLKLILSSGGAEEECYIEDAAIVEELDKYLVIPVHSMFWSFLDQDKPHPIGHSSLSFQNYSGGVKTDSYFHHGVDIMMPQNSPLYNIYEGRVTIIDHYDLSGGTTSTDPHYFQVVVETINGLTIQYHHTDENTVTDAVRTSKKNGGILAKGANVGKIVTWNVADTFSGQMFNHNHLNILTAKDEKLNVLELLIPHPDTIAPEIKDIYFINSAKNLLLDPAAGIADDFFVIIEASDMMDDNVWPLPPRLNSFVIRDSAGTEKVSFTGYDFLSTFGTDMHTSVCEYYLCGDAGFNTLGDYGNRQFFININAFTETGAKGSPVLISDLGAGDFVLTAESCDEYGNCTEKTAEFTVIQ